MAKNEATHKRINIAYLTLLALLVAGGTFEGLLKLMPEQASSNVVASNPVIAHDSISQTAAAAIVAPEQREAPIRVPIISTVPMETIRVATPHFQTVPRHSKVLHKQNLHSEISPAAAPVVASLEEVNGNLDLRLVPEAIVLPKTEEHQVSTYVLMKKAK